MKLVFSGELWFWRGPAPWHFVTMPEAQCAALHEVAAEVSYGWGCIAAAVRIGDTSFTTSLIPKDGRFLVPVKAAVRRAEQLDLGDTTTLEVTIAA